MHAHVINWSSSSAHVEADDPKVWFDLAATSEYSGSLYTGFEKARK